LSFFATRKAERDGKCVFVDDQLNRRKTVWTV